jgi:hypothetical protein
MRLEFFSQAFFCIIVPLLQHWLLLDALARAAASSISCFLIFPFLILRPMRLALSQFLYMNIQPIPTTSHSILITVPLSLKQSACSWEAIL